MDITYLGHSCFKLRSSAGTAITDPYDQATGLKLPKVSADIVTSSHNHHDHNNVSAVSGTARRNQPLIIDQPGEYEASGISVFGFRSFHDDKQGAERGSNTIFVIHIEGIKVGHLGDLGHELSDKQTEIIDGIDVLLCPVGGRYTINPTQALKVAASIQPSIFIPMHYNRSGLNQDTFGQLATLKDFLQEAGAQDPQTTDKLTVTSASLPDEMEIIVLES